MKKVFVTGSGGMMGSRFVELFEKKYELLTPEIGELDLTDKKVVEAFVKKEKPDCIVHFAAFTDVSAAEIQREDEKGMCWKVNVEATRNLVEAVDPNSTHFMHISTDMVFSGSKSDPGPYKEDHEPEDDPEKLTWYGYTKKVAEDVVREALGGNLSVLRLIYPVRVNYDKKLDPQVRARLKLFDEGRLYPLFNNQQISISDVDEICEVIEQIIKKRACGTFHASSVDVTTPYELGSYLIEKAQGKANAVKQSSFDEYVKESVGKNRWPKFGSLSVKATQVKLGIKFSTWKQIVDKMVSLGV